MTHSDFGRYLSQQRELRGLSREEISRATKIAPTLLEALEEGDARRLPDRVFVIHWVKAYAEVIGLEPSEAALRYEEVGREEIAKSAPAPTPSMPSVQKPRSVVPWVILALAVVVAAALGFWLRR